MKTQEQIITETKLEIKAYNEGIKRAISILEQSRGMARSVKIIGLMDSLIDALKAEKIGGVE